MRNAKLTSAECGRTNFFHTNLDDADLTGSDFYEADLNRASLCNTDLSNARLRYADFSNANLAKANFNGANLSFANLTGVDFSEVDISSAKSLFEAVLPEDVEEKLKREKPELFEPVEP